MYPERVCSTCTDRNKKEWGCDAKQDENGVWTNRSMMPERIDDVDTWVCPRRPIKDEPFMFGEIMSLYSLYKEGVLANEGSITSQALRYVTTMRLVAGTVSECQAVKMEDT